MCLGVVTEYETKGRLTAVQSRGLKENKKKDVDRGSILPIQHAINDTILPRITGSERRLGIADKRIQRGSNKVIILRLQILSREFVT